MPGVGWSGIQYTITGLWSDEHDSLPASLMDVILCLGNARRALFTKMIMPVRFGRGRIMICGFFQRLGPLFPVKGHVNFDATAYKDILLPTFWQQFEAGLFLFQHENPPVHTARVIKIWFD